MSRRGGSATPATKALDAAGTAYELRAYDHDPRSDSYGTEAAEKLGVEPARVFKTLLAEVDGDLVVAIVPVTGQLDLKALAVALSGKRAVLADQVLALHGAVDLHRHSLTARLDEGQSALVAEALLAEDRAAATLAHWGIDVDAGELY